MNVLVTGGAGYLGAVLVPRLLANGHAVTVLDLFEHGVPSLLHVATNARLTIQRLDLRGVPSLFTMERYDAIVHLAALVGAPACDARPETAREVNVAVTRHLVLAQLAVHPHAPFIFPCTNSGYGRGGTLPCTEDDPMTPLSLYGRTKVEAERIVLAHPRGISLRFATLYGPSPRMRLDLLVNDLTHRAARDGRITLYEPEFRRCVLHVEDAARAILSALMAHRQGLARKSWNVGAENVTKRELAEAIKHSVPGLAIEEVEGRDPDQRDYAVSSARFLAATGWRPKTPLRVGIEQLVAVLKTQPLHDGVASGWRNA